MALRSLSSKTATGGGGLRETDSTPAPPPQPKTRLIKRRVFALSWESRNYLRERVGFASRSVVRRAWRRGALHMRGDESCDRIPPSQRKNNHPQTWVFFVFRGEILDSSHLARNGSYFKLASSACSSLSPLFLVYPAAPTALSSASHCDAECRAVFALRRW